MPSAIQYAYLPLNGSEAPALDVGALPLKETPASRLSYFGPAALNNRELLAAIIGGPHQLTIAWQLLQRYKTFTRIQSAAESELLQIDHLGKASVSRLKAAFEIGNRRLTENKGEEWQIRAPSDAANILMPDMMGLEQEEMRILVLDTKNHVTACPTLYRGNVNTSIVRVAEIVRCAIVHGAVSILIAHNHPSGDPTPSPEDVRVTERIVEAAKLMDIDVLDHIVIGKQRFISLKERRLGFD